MSSGFVERGVLAAGGGGGEVTWRSKWQRGYTENYGHCIVEYTDDMMSLSSESQNAAKLKVCKYNAFF